MVAESKLRREAETGLHLYEVGKPFPGGLRGMANTTGYGYGDTGHHLVFCWPEITPGELQALRNGDVDLGLVAWEELVFLLYRVPGAFQWSDVLFSIHLQDEARRAIPPKTHGSTRALMNIWVVDSETGILKVMRQATMSPHFTRSLHDAIRKQAAMPFDADQYLSRIRDVYALYPKSRDMLRIAVAKCKLGD